VLLRCHGASGQSFMRAMSLVLDKPSAPETVHLALDLLGGYFARVRGAALTGHWPEALQREVAAMAALAALSHADALPILSKTTAVGPLMRRHLEPVLAPVLAQIHILRGRA